MNFRTQSLAALAAMALVLTPALAGCGQTAENVAESWHRLRHVAG
ncbi:MAG: hypothetical protein WAO33_03400 [Candidatus Nanopelagicales bacterium]